MNQFVLVTVIFGLLTGCQKAPEQKPKTEAVPQAEQSPPVTPKQTPEREHRKIPPSPPPRHSKESKVWLTSAQGKPGEQVKVEIHYYLNEPAKTIVVPLTFPGNAVVDSFSWVGSPLAGYQMRPTQTRNDLKIFLAAVVPLDEPDIPADTGFLGSIYFTIEKDAPPQTVAIETTFIYPGNTLQYIDTLIGQVTPQWVPGSIKVVK